MADRTVSARLRLDVAGYLTNARAAQTATRRIADEAERVGGRTTTAFTGTTQAVKETSRSLGVAASTARRAGADIEGASLAVRRAQLSAADATVKAEKAQRAAADATDRLASKEIDQAEAARLVARAERETERASIAHATAAQRATDDTDRHTAAQRKLGGQLQTTARGLTANRATLVSLVAAGVAAGAGITSAGVAFGAFGVIAAGSIVPVIAAQKDLAASWSTLDARQKIAATSVRGLVGDYKALSKSFEPQAMKAFNSVIGDTRVLLPQVGSLATATAGDVNRLVNRFGEFVTGRVGGEFLTWAGQQAPAALDLLGTTMITAGDTALDLVQDVAPLGLGVLSLANSTLGLVNGLANVNPLLAQMAIGGLALRAPVAGLVSGFDGFSKRVSTASAATSGMSKSARALNLVTSAGPNLYVAAGVAIAFLGLKLLSAKTSTDRFIDGLREVRYAAGNNTQIYAQHAQLLQSRYVQAVQRSNEVTSQSESTFGAVSSEMKKTGDEARKVAQQYTFMTTNGDRLARSLGVGRTEALRFADVAGVNLATNVDKAGRLTQAAQQKIDQYRQSVALAADPTRQVSLALADAGNKALAMKDRLNGLNVAMDALFGPSIQAYQVTTQLKQGYQSLITTLAAAKGNIDGNSAASLRVQAAFAQQLLSVRQLAAATLAKTGSEKQARAAVAAQLPVLYALAGRNRDARTEIDKLAQSTGNTVGATNTSRAAFMRQAASMSISKERAAALWREFRRVTTVADTTHNALELLSRERKLRMNISDWQSKIATGKANLKSVPPEKRAKLLANIADLQAKVKAAKAALASVKSKEVTITTILKNIEAGKRVTGYGRVHQARGGVYAAGMVRRYAAGDVARAVPATHAIEPNITNSPVALYGEAGPEAYIPLDPARRGRSTEILGMVADMFGMRLVPMAGGGATAYAAGGATGRSGGGGQPEGGYRDLIGALSDTKGEMDGNSAAAQRLQDRFTAQLAVVRNLNIATGDQTRQVDRASGAARAQLPLLASLSGRSQQARAQVDALGASTASTTGRQNTATGALARVGTQMSATRARTEGLWREYSRVPGQTSRAAGGVENFSGRTRASLAALRSKNLNVHVFADGKFTRASGLAGGGPVPKALALAGGGPTEDDVPLWGSVGEHMWAAREVDAVGGHQAMYRMRAAARRGEMRGLAAGGAVDFTAPTPSAAATSKAVGVGGEHLKLVRSGQAAFEEARFLAAAWKKYMASGGAALAWARTQAGKPYQWGGVGPAGYDCSGLWSALRNVIAHRNPHSRLFTTHSFGASGPSGFVRGLRSPVMVGVTDAGVGHMAGTLGNVAVESSGSAGVRVGGGARGASNGLFSRQYGLRMATGGAIGEVERRLADRALRASAAREEIALAAALGLVGDPSSPISPARPAGLTDGGWVHGRPGADRVPLMGTAGEFMVNRVQSAANGPLLEAVNQGLGEALLRRSIRGGLARGGDGASGGGGGGGITHITVELHNHGVIGSQLDMDTWLSKSMERLDRQGRLPAALTR